MDILLIEDDLNDAEYIRNILPDTSIDVYASPPEEVTKEYDLIICDYFLGGVTSREFIESTNLDTPLIIISGKVDEVDVSSLPKSLNALIISKNENFKGLLQHYAKLLCRDEKVEKREHFVDYKTLFLDLVHDLKNDLMWCSYFDYLSRGDVDMDEDYLKDKIVHSSIFAFTRLTEMSDYVNSEKEVYSSLKESFEHIKGSRVIEEHKDAIEFSGEADKNITFVSSFFLSVILKNLIENSCKYADPEKPLKIDISYTEDMENHTLTVKDNAKGMTKDQSKKLFTRRRKSDSGMGMGLVVLNRIIKSHKGSIKVKTQLGQGTSIYINFPKVRPN